MNNLEDKFIILADNVENISRTTEKINYPRVENINWSINVTTANDEKQGIMEPHALLHLTLVNNVSKYETHTTFDFNEEECVKFYELLENIQQKLDDLCKE